MEFASNNNKNNNNFYVLRRKMAENFIYNPLRVISHRVEGWELCVT